MSGLPVGPGPGPGRGPGAGPGPDSTSAAPARSAGSSTDGPAPGDRLDRWIRIEADGTATLRTGKVEIGQGLHLALAALVADELELPIERVRVAPVDTAESPDEGITSGSRSMEETGRGVHLVAAEAREAILAAAAVALGATPAELHLDNGRVTGPDGSSVDLARLAADGCLAAAFRGDGRPKPPGTRQVIGAMVARRDLPAKVSGLPVFIQDLELPGMLHGRAVRPPGPNARLTAFDEDAVRALPGVVAVVRDGSFLGVVAEREEQAIAALEQARRSASWDEGDPIPAIDDPRYLLGAESDETVAREVEDPAALARAGTRLQAEFTRPYLAHAAIGPSCSVAVVEDDGGTLRVWSHSQGIFRLRHELARVLGLPGDRVRVIHGQGAGCYGHNGADDAALDAALLARAVPGRPVRVQWMREDEFGWEPLGTPMVVRLSAALDADGRIVDWRHDGWGHGSGSRPSMADRPGVVSLLAARHLAEPSKGATSQKSGDLRNARPLYAIPNQRIVGHFVRLAPLRTSSLRGLGAHVNVFAIESMMDELAEQAGVDPVEFRLRHLDDPRARAVIEAAANLAGWQPGERGDGVRGRGIGFARYKDTSAWAAVVVEAEVDPQLRVVRAWGAIDAGMVVSPDGLRNQSEGGIVQAVSIALHEAIRTEGARVATVDWETYPILTFSEAPEVEIALVDRPEEPPLGAGEAFAGPTTAAIANAIWNAVGIRVRDLPFTRERLEAAID